jgi:hypothetical protein
LSLPLAFKTEIKSIPSKIPYIHTEPDRDKKWAQYLGKDGFKIAISWEGSQKGQEEGRTFPLHLFESIAKIIGVRLISIQKNTGRESRNCRKLLSFKISNRMNLLKSYQ